MPQSDEISDPPVAGRGTDDPAFIPVHGVQNLRDVGGLETTDGGRLQPGSLFRSAQLGDHGDEMLHGLTDLGLEVVFDLRTDHEVGLLPDFLPDHVELVHLDVLAETDSSVATHLEDLFVDPESANDILRSGQVTDHYLDTYRKLVTLGSARRSYAEMFTRIATTRNVALFHCTAGKDRTGWAAAALQLLLGVSRRDVAADYLMSNAPVLALFQPVLDRFEEAGGDPSLLAPVFGVETIYLDAALGEVYEHFRSIEGYFIEGLGLDRQVLEALRQRLLM